MQLLPSTQDIIKQYDSAIHEAMKNRDFDFYEILITERNKLISKEIVDYFAQQKQDSVK